MIFTVNTSDPLPIYRQIERQVIDAVLQGKLAAGEKLPSHRDLASRLVVAPLTVKKAYDTLEAQGIVETRRGMGTFVCGSLPRLCTSERKDRLKERAERLVLEAKAAGASWQEVLEVLRNAENDLNTRLDRE